MLSIQRRKVNPLVCFLLSSKAAGVCVDGLWMAVSITDIVLESHVKSNLKSCWKWEDEFKKNGSEKAHSLLFCPWLSPPKEQASFTASGPQIINQIKCCSGIILLIQNSAVPLKFEEEVYLFSCDQVAWMCRWCGCDSQPSRPLNYLDLMVLVLFSLWC